MKKVVTSLLITLILAGCLVLGLAVSAADTPALTIRSASLSLESNVYIWFDMSLENVDKDADDYGMIFWKATQKAGSYTYENAQGNEAAVVRDKAAGQWTHDDTLNCDVVTYKYGISAKEMADVVYAQGYAKVGESYYYSSIVPYSAVRYASNKLGLTPGVTGTDDENLKSLLRSMLEYGAAAQKYFNYNTDNLATDILNVKYSEGLEFTSNGDGTCYVSGIGTCTDTDVVIPKVSPEGEEVTSIDYEAFRGCASLTSVTIPDSVTDIGGFAFKDCASLTSVAIPDSVTSIGGSAFWNCTSITDIMIPNSVTSIGSNAFQSCTNLTSITIPNSVTKIDFGAFSSCSNIESIIVESENQVYHSTSNCLIETASKTLIAVGKNSVIPTDGSVTSIGRSAFSGCSIASITIPDIVTSIGISAFYNCTSLESITIPDSVTSIDNWAFRNTAYYSNEANWENGTLYIGNHLIGTNSNKLATNYEVKAGTKCIAGGAFNNCTSLTSITIPDSVTSIGRLAFSHCTSLTSITIPDSVTSIGVLAFNNCTSLTSIIIPDGVTSIGDFVFSDCTSLASITIPDSVTNIGDSAFSGCTSITSITIPDSVTSIGDGAFGGCLRLESISVNPENGVYRSIDNCLIDKTSKELIAGCKNSIIPTDGSVTSIGDSAFYDCYMLTSITIPDSVTSIGDFAFRGCNNLTRIMIPNSVTSIGDFVFSGCWHLTSITIPDSVTSIGKRAFSGCTSLTSIKIPNSVTSIGDYAFSSCKNLKTITFQGTEEQWNAITKGTDWNYNTGKSTSTASYTLIFEN